MKNILHLTFLFIFCALSAQSISDFSYIKISRTGDFKNNEYGLINLLQTKLQERKYLLLPDDVSLWPENAQKNPCQILKAELKNTSSFFKNKVRVDFKDCKDQTIAYQEGTSSIKDYEPGYREALGFALKPVPQSNGLAQNNIQISAADNEAFTAKKVIETGAPAIFSNGNMKFNQIFISEDQFILAEADQSTPFATFKNSSKKEVYHVRLRDGQHTLGYTEDGSVVVDMPFPDGTFRKEIFRKL